MISEIKLDQLIRDYQSANRIRLRYYAHARKLKKHGNGDYAKHAETYKLLDRSIKDFKHHSKILRDYLKQYGLMIVRCDGGQWIQRVDLITNIKADNAEFRKRMKQSIAQWAVRDLANKLNKKPI